MKQQIAAFTLAASLLVATAVPAMAAETDGSLTLNGGTRTITPTTITMTTTGLTGMEQTIAGSTTPWSVVDATGLGDGWNVTVAATEFAEVGTPANTIPLTGFSIRLLDENIELVDGNTVPISSQIGYAALSATALPIAVAAVEEGMGSFTIEPEFTLVVPAATYAGDYDSTVTVTVSVPL